MLRRRCIHAIAALSLCVSATSGPAAAVELVRHVSRESPLLNVPAARLAIGADGNAYLASGEYVLRIGRDGSGKLGGKVTSALNGATANAGGIIATANAHFSHSVNLWTSRFERLGGVDDFLNNDKVQYLSPCGVEAGASGDFYGMDENRSRVVRVAAPGRLVTTYPLEKLGEDLVGRLVQFRVSEPGKRFYVHCPSGNLRVIGFDGRLLWSINPGIGGNPWDGWRGAFDVDDSGRLLVIQDDSDVVKTYDRDGRPSGLVTLAMGRRKGRVSDLRVYRNDILIKRPDPVELFQVYDRSSGKPRRIVRGDVERVTVGFQSDLWTAGSTVPLSVGLDAVGRDVRPDWRVWLRPLNAPRFAELPRRDGAVVVPADAGGFYQLRVSAERDGGADEYSVDTVVEIRRRGARGSVSLLTPHNRVYYGRGERIPIAVVCRAPTGVGLPESLTVRLLDGDRTVSETALRPDPRGRTSLSLPPSVTAALRPGHYLVTGDAPGFTVAPQPLVIGPGLHPSRFSIVQYGDYHDGFPKGDMFDTPEKVAAHLARSRALGVNMYVDRLGSPVGLVGSIDQTLTPNGLLDRVKSDPRSPAPEKAVVDSPVRQSIAGYGAFDIEQQGILLNMDAGLPVGTSFDARKPAELTEAIGKVAHSLAAYPAFRGWTWAANWWIGPRGAAAVSDPRLKADYEAALKRATDSGAWDPVLDRVSDIWLNYAVDAERRFRITLEQAAPGKLSVLTGPYRAVGVIPPVTYRNADEVDLHYQAEQIQPPQVTPHNVDFSKRPGKRAWGHPEVWNDDGTGGMIFPTLFQMVMRGADGVGWTGNVPEWGTGPSDSRSGAPGSASVYRNLDALLANYGPWLTTLQPSDRVAIVCSSRMLRIDDWAKIGGHYFDRLFEAYNSCLYAQRPASFVFAEDVRPDTLKGYKAVLVVGQRVELDPALADALASASRAGVWVGFDATCRPELVKGFTPLGVAFDQVENDASGWQDDSAYVRFPGYFRRNAAVLAEALKSVVPPVAGCDEPDVMLTERRSGEARFVWAVNNTSTGLEPGMAWRVGMMISQRLPLVARLSLGAKGQAVYDVFALRACSGESVEADLRTLPARLYAILPAPIAQISAQAPRSLAAGQELSWSVSVEDDRRRAIRASLPVWVRLLAADGSLIAERNAAADGEGGLKGTFTLPLNISPGPAVFEAIELVSGKSARLEITVGSAPPQTPVGAKAGDFAPGETRFGPHIKEIAITLDGTTALLNAFNWDQNVYAIDTRTGDVRWRSRVGHHFAYGPRGIADGFAVQGFDLKSAEGYHLYLLNRDGLAERRFALFGLPKRATAWLTGAQLADRINHFAVAPDGSWIASSGDLGLAVWDRSGHLLWSLDWWKTARKRVPLVALDQTTLVALDGTLASAYRAKTGERVWAVNTSSAGALVGGSVSKDGRTLALWSDAEGGRVYIIRDGKLVNTLTTAADDLALTPEGAALAVTTGNQLKWYDADRGLVWGLTGDDVLRTPRVAPDGRRVCVASELGTLYLLDRAGSPIARRNLGALAAPAWLPDGDLLVATWMGAVVRYDGALKERWRSRLQPAVRNIRPQLVEADPTPTTRPNGWGNASAQPLALTPNLLRETNAVLTATSDPPVHGDPRPWQNPIDLLRDGKPDAPPAPWLAWTDVNYIDSGWRGKLVLEADAFRTRLRLTGVTMVEDRSHPESWLRDVRLQWWDAAAEQWRDGPYLLSNAVVHTHRIDPPLDAARFRLTTTGGGTWPAGNVRLGELVFHGESLGCSHPDAVAQRPVAVLFDEREDELAALKYPDRPFAFRYEGAYSGGKCLVLTGPGEALPTFHPPFGHALPNWDFEVAERPRAGQYRYLQFAWRALSPTTTGIALVIGKAWPGGGINVVAGRHDWREGAIATKQVGGQPPNEWKVVRVDLWALAKAPFRIQALTLGASGGGAAFDQILLGRTAEDLDRVKPVQ
ncbi:MAG: hypothetical protein P4L84_14020 [Isosphaeraceae bacterium]|nr:hypothetical protein [Isosphaeraceae bacterium]